MVVRIVTSLEAADVASDPGDLVHATVTAMRREHGVDGSLAALTDTELDAVVRLVQALVDEDVDLLRAAGAYRQGADPYLWTRRYGPWEQVHLVLPPGDPKRWGDCSVVRLDGGRVGVDVGMWTNEEGPSDLTLQLDLRPGGSGPEAMLLDLHVM